MFQTCASYRENVAIALRMIETLGRSEDNDAAIKKRWNMLLWLQYSAFTQPKKNFGKILKRRSVKGATW